MNAFPYALNFMYLWQNEPLGVRPSLVSACSLSAYTDQSPGQWQLPLIDGFGVRTRVLGVWGSIPSQFDPITYSRIHTVRLQRF